MNILVVTPYPPVLHMHGGAVRMYHNIRLLAQKHCVRVLSFVENDEEKEHLKSAGPVCESVTAIDRVSDLGAHWTSLVPFVVREFGTPAMHQAVDEALRLHQIDVIQCEYLQMAQYKRAGAASILTILETHSDNAYHAFQAEPDAIQKLRKFSGWMSMLNYEVSMCNAFDRVVTMTDEDAAYLRSYARHADVRAIPIGVDAEYFRPATDPSPKRPVQIVFIGNYRHPPNVIAAEFLLREIAPYFPDIELVIAGSNAPKSPQALHNVAFPGYVVDTRQLFQMPDTIFVAPLFTGTGQRVKLLEAFAMGAAVVTTSLALAGFPVVNGVQAMIANNATEFRTAVATLAASEELRSRLGREARSMIETHFNWDSIGRQFMELIEGLK